MPRIDHTAFEALTFDCYGTLIDWRGGVRSAAASMASLAGCDVDRLLADRVDEEARLQRGEFQTYDRVLAASIQRAGAHQGREVPKGEAVAFAASIGTWPPFPDSRAMLRRLAGAFRLAILSNIQPDVLEQSLALLGVPFDVTVTAGEVRSYKPARPHFDEGLRRLGLSKERVLHCACSLYHDVVPAREMGWSVVWVNRDGEEVPPGLESVAVVPDLVGLVDLLGLQSDEPLDPVR